MARVGEALRFACPVHVTGPCTSRQTFRPAMRPTGHRRLDCNYRASQTRNRLFSRTPTAQKGSSHPAQEEEVTPLLDAPLVEVAQLLSGPKEPGAAIDGPGIYAIYSSDGTLQYIGLSRKLRVSLETHKEGLPELVHSVRLLPVPGADREQLAPLWRAWVQQAVAVSGGLPPGNASPEQQKRWQRRHVPRPKAELRLTPGKGADKLTVSVDELVAGAVRAHKVIVFLKGTRLQPRCRFSHRVLEILMQIGEHFEVVDVLDEVHNPGVREAIKRHSEWPTLPQIFVEGEFIGGADIVEQMHAAGQLAELMGR